MKVLAIGNSFSDDSTEYVFPVLQALGAEDLSLGNLHIGGCSLQRHANNIQNNTPDYDFRTNTKNQWETVSEYPLEPALCSQAWEVVSLQQASHDSGLQETYQPLAQIIAFIREKLPYGVKLAWNMTWAYQQDSTHEGFANYGKEQKKTGIIFAPYDLITREEAATILNRIAVYLGMDMPQIIDAVYYWDESNISDWAIDAVKTMRQFGIMEGVNGYEFYPKGTYTVEQAIATMVRLYDKIKLEWEAAFNYSDFNKANHGEGENFQRNSGIEYISGKAVKTIYDDYTLTGDNLNHLSWAKIGYDDYYGGLYLGISMIAHHLIADDEFSSLCSEMVTNMYDGTSVKDNADFANEHFTISINGTPVKIKAVGMGKGNGHHDYYFALDTDINRYDINEIDFECKL